MAAVLQRVQYAAQGRLRKPHVSTQPNKNPRLAARAGRAVNPATEGIGEKLRSSGVVVLLLSTALRRKLETSERDRPVKPNQNRIHEG